MNSLWQVPVVVASLLTWLSAPPESIADGASREAVRRQLAGPSTAVYTNLDLPGAMTVPVAGSRQSPGSGDEVPEADRGEEVIDADLPTPAGAPTDGPVGAPVGTPPAPATGTAETAAEPAVNSEAWWRLRAATLRSTIQRHEATVEAMQARVNGLATDVANRDDPFQREELRRQLQKALADLDRVQAAIIDGRLALEALHVEARRTGTPPGWLR
jgi:hypothetical protein